MVMGTIALLAVLLAAVICGCSGAFANMTWLWMLPACWLGCMLGIILLIFLLVLLMCALVKPDVEQEKDNRLYRLRMRPIRCCGCGFTPKAWKRFPPRGGFCWCATI